MRSEAKLLASVIESFSDRMKAKMEKKRKQRWSGWRDETYREKLEMDLLWHLKHALQGDARQWVDVANYAAFLDYQSTALQRQ